MTKEQRLHLAEQLTQLRRQLQTIEDKRMLLRDLSEDLQKALRSQPAIGPLTTSGIEHVFQIFNRLDVVIFNLKDLSVEVNELGKHIPIKPADKPNQTSGTTALRPAIRTQMNSTNQVEHVTITRLPKSDQATKLAVSTTSSDQPKQAAPPPSEPPSELDFGPFDPRKGAK